MTRPGAHGGDGTLPRELDDLLLELALAVQRFSIYPGGHPSADAAVARLAERLEALFATREMVSIGVARRQLIVEGVATEPSHRVLRALAERLHRHRLGAVVIRRGADPEELQSALCAVAEDPERSGAPLGTAGRDRLAEWPHVGFHGVSYDRLQLSETEPDGAPTTGSGSTGATQLWVGLAQAALAGDGFAGGAGPLDRSGSSNDATADRGADASRDPAESGADPVDVARAINGRPAEDAYDQPIVGYLLQLAGELRRSGEGDAGIRRHMSVLIRQLEPGRLERLLEMGGNHAQRGRFLLDATDALQPDAVLELLRAAATSREQDISTSMMRMLTKLAAFADGTDSASARAETELKQQVKELLDGWSLSDPNPDAYTKALDALARRPAGGRAARSGVSAGEDGDAAESGGPLSDDPDAASAGNAEALRVVQMAIEVEAVGPALWRAIQTLEAEGRLRDLLDLATAAGPAHAAGAALWRHLEGADHIRRVLTTDPVDFESLDRIFERLPPSTVLSLLLDRISESASRNTRMGVFRRLAARGLAAVPAIVERLQDERWYVQRNMLALLDEIDAWPTSFSPLAHTAHPEPAVRREAFQMAVRVPAERDQAIRRALDDADDRVVRTGAGAARQHGLPAACIQSVLRQLRNENLEPDLRLALIRLLGQHAHTEAIDYLAGMVAYERRLLGPRMLPVTPDLLAAVSALARLKPQDGRGARVLEMARASEDAAVRRAAGARQ